MFTTVKIRGRKTSEQRVADSSSGIGGEPSPVHEDILFQRASLTLHYRRYRLNCLYHLPGIRDTLHTPCRRSVDTDSLLCVYSEEFRVRAPKVNIDLLWDLGDVTSWHVHGALFGPRTGHRLHKLKYVLFCPPVL
jgi:hypothetical protein